MRTRVIEQATARLPLALETGSMLLSKEAVKTNLVKRRFKAPKRSSCALCRPHKRGWEYKKTPGELRTAVKHAQELREQGFSG